MCFIYVLGALRTKWAVKLGPYTIPCFHPDMVDGPFFGLLPEIWSGAGILRCGPRAAIMSCVPAVPRCKSCSEGGHGAVGASIITSVAVPGS